MPSMLGSQVQKRNLKTSFTSGFTQQSYFRSGLKLKEVNIKLKSVTSTWVDYTLFCESTGWSMLQPSAYADALFTLVFMFCELILPSPIPGYTLLCSHRKSSVAVASMRSWLAAAVGTALSLLISCHEHKTHLCTDNMAPPPSTLPRALLANMSSPASVSSPSFLYQQQKKP